MACPYILKLIAPHFIGRNFGYWSKRMVQLGQKKRKAWWLCASAACWECRDYPCAPPEIVADEEWYRFVLRRPVREGRLGARLGAQSNVVLAILAEGECSASELVRALNLKSKTGAFKRTLFELLEREFIEYTIPEKPNSRLQKYRLTSKGLCQLENERK